MLMEEPLLHGGNGIPRTVKMMVGIANIVRVYCIVLNINDIFKQ